MSLAFALDCLGASTTEYRTDNRHSGFVEVAVSCVTENLVDALGQIGCQMMQDVVAVAGWSGCRKACSLD